MVQQAISYPQAAAPTARVPVQPTLSPDVRVIIERDNNGQLAVGNNILQVGANAGNLVILNQQENLLTIEARPRPIERKPRPFTNLIGRQMEVQDAREALQLLQPVEFFAEAGMGKSSLLKHLSHQAHQLPDGTLFLNAKGLTATADLLELIFDAFYESRQGQVQVKVGGQNLDDLQIKLTQGRLLHYLHGLQALIVLDDVELPPDQLDTLLNALPLSAILFASPDQRCWGEGLPCGLQGLSPVDGVALFIHKLGRPLSGLDQTVARDLCVRLGGHPLRIVQTAALARKGDQEANWSLSAFRSALLARPGGLPATLHDQWLEESDKRERQLLSVLAAVNGTSLHREHLEALLGPGTGDALAELTNQGVVEKDGDEQFRLGGGLAAAATAWDLAPWQERLAEQFAKWAAIHRDEPALIARDARAIRALINAAEVGGRPRTVVQLARALEGPLALSKQWEAWAEVLGQALSAARAIGAPADEAWALHQLGTRAYSLGERNAARSAWKKALRIRRALGDHVGAELTRYHLELPHYVPRDNDPRGERQPPARSSPAPAKRMAPSSTVPVTGTAAGKLLLAIMATLLVGLSSLLIWMGQQDAAATAQPTTALMDVVPTMVFTPTLARVTVSPVATPLPATATPAETLVVALATAAEPTTPFQTVIFPPTPRPPTITPAPVLSPSATVPLSPTPSPSPTDTTTPRPPVVTIESPGLDATFGGDMLITFTATAADGEGNDLSRGIVWSSNINGPFAEGKAVTKAVGTFTAGPHTITARVTDIRGQVAEATVVITVLRPPPRVNISKPSPDQAYEAGSPITFAGTAEDVNGNDLTALLVWTSSLDGEIGRGGGFERVLSAGTHTITAMATDEQKSAGEASVVIEVAGVADLVARIVPVAPVYENEAGHLIVPVNVVVGNVGNGPTDADSFKIAVTSARYLVPFNVPPGSDSFYAFHLGVLNPGETATIAGEVRFVYATDLFGQTVPIWATADSCAGEELVPRECRVRESSETNNDSRPVAITFPGKEPPTPPQVTIERPDNGESFPATGFADQGRAFAKVTFVATVSDAEDKNVPDSAIVWTTNRNDMQPVLLGTGRALGAELFTSGCESSPVQGAAITGVDAWESPARQESGDTIHRVVVTATDSDGQSSQATVDVIVRCEPFQSPLLTVGLGQLN